MTEGKQRERATLGGGCFWCLEAVYQQLSGVEEVVSGYAGGDAPDPTYEQVCSGSTGHAEVVQITYDPDEIIFRDLLDVFFTIHDPTTLNRQGADVGTQYRSIILYDSADQEAAARAAIEELEADAIYEDSIVTEVEPLEQFHAAEPHHQNYYRRNGGQPYCQAVIAPKIAKLRQQYLDKLKV